jgi:hypothetical protein
VRAPSVVLETVAVKVAVSCAGAALIVFSLLGGIALITHQVGPSVAEICADKGGHWEQIEDYTNKEGNKYTSKCEPAQR